MKSKHLLTTLVLLLVSTFAIAQSANEWRYAILIDNGDHASRRMGDYGIYGTNVVDWFQIIVPDEGLVTISTKSDATLRLGQLKLHFLNESGSDVVFRSSMDMDNYNKDTTLVFTIPDCAPGIYYLQLEHYNGAGYYKIKYNFTANAYGPDSNDNDSWDKAIDLNVDTYQDGRLGYTLRKTDVVDWYKIQINEDGKFTFIAKSEATLRLGNLSLFTLNADGTDVVFRTSKDMDNYNKDTTMVFEVPNVSAGIYYVKLEHYNGYGGYRIMGLFTGHSEEADAEPNDSWSQALPLRNGPTVTGQLGYDYNNSTDGEDWYKIEVPKEGSAILSTSTETTLRLGTMSVFVLNTESTDIVLRTSKDMDGYAKDTTVVFNLPDLAPGTYYIKMQRYNGYGTYKLQYVFNPNIHQNDPEVNNSWDKASLVENDATQEGCLGYSYNQGVDGEDWYKIEVPDEGSVVLSTTAELTLRLGGLSVYYLNADGTDIILRNTKDMDDYGKDTTMVFTLPDMAPGTYYLKVVHYRGYGGYKLNYVFTANTHGADVAGNDNWANATAIEMGAIQHGRLGYRYDGTDEVDWFSFTVPSDGDVVLSMTADATLRLGSLSWYIPNAEGTDVVFVASKDMDNYNKDTTMVYTLSGLSPGIYYLKQQRYRDYGGYDLQCEFNRNPYDKDRLDNTTFAKRAKLDEGKTISTTLGYRYLSTNTEDWYDLGKMHGRQIDVTVAPDSARTLNIGEIELYQYKGDNADGTPDLSRVAKTRLERSAGTLSYIDQNTNDVHYVFRVPQYSGYGGYTITFGDAETANGQSMAGMIKVMTGGRNTVRKGVPCENPITITNTSDQKTGPFMIGVASTHNINILGFYMNGNRGSEFIPIDSITVMDDGDCQRTAVFYVPNLDPWESYTFTMVSEGKGDIAYSRAVVSTFVAVTVLGYVADAVIGDKIDDFINDQVSATIDLDETEQEQYARFMGLTTQQLGIQKQETGIAAYTVKSVIKKTCTNVIEAVPGGKIVTKIGSALETLQSIVPSIRRRIWYWIYKDLGYIKDGPEVIDGKLVVTDVVASWDPNEMVGPAGVGENHYIGETKTINYRILFENKAEAGDAAYRIRITDELDESVFDVSTVRFGGTSHDGKGYNWEMTRSGNKLSWDIKGIELPPNVYPPQGEGYVSFSVDLKPGLTDGAKLKNKATIIFDKNTPIETNEFVNTLDLVAPVTTMQSVTKAKGDSVQVVCQSVDSGSGVESYLLFAAKGDGDFEYQGQFYSSTMVCPAADGGKDYRYYVLAVDGVGNTEQTTPEAISTGIFVTRADRPVNLKVYTLEGRYVGNTLHNLRKGVYIINGHKYIKE